MKFRVPNKENHYALWDWLSRNPESEKKGWPGYWTIMRNMNKIVMNYAGHFGVHACFACQEAGIECPQCPCDWKPAPKCQTYFSPGVVAPSSFERWESSKNPEERAALARQIRDCWK
jgi:hypothetical protein